MVSFMIPMGPLLQGLWSFYNEIYEGSISHDFPTMAIEKSKALTKACFFYFLFFLITWVERFV